MYVKFNKSKSGGGVGSVNYLLNERVSDGTAKVLSGNPELTKAIIKEMKNKHKVTMGSINFKEGETLTASQKETIMSDFEKTLLPGLDKEQYNILWVQHTDKGRLELNFVIPKVELTTQKAMNPYFHAHDFARIDMFEDIQNIKYNLESKKDPANAQTLQGEKRNINIVKDYKELDRTLHQLVQSRDIQSREQMIELLNKNSIKVTRQNSEGISVKLPESKKAHKLKGGIYNEQFTSYAELETISEATDRRAEEFQQRDTRAELQRTTKRLEEYNEQKAGFNRVKFQKVEQKLDNNISNEQSNSRADIGSMGNERVQSAEREDNRSREDNQSSRYPDNRRTFEQQSIARNREKEYERGNREVDARERGHDEVHQKQTKQQGVSDDIRRRVIERARERAVAQREAHEEARRARGELYKSTKEQSEELRKQSLADSRELQREYEPIIEKSRELVGTVTELEKPITRVIDSLRELSRECVEYIKDTRDRIKDKIREYADRFNDLSFKKDNTILNEGLNTQKEELTFAVQESCRVSLNENINYHNKINQQEQSNDYGMSM